MVRFAFVFLITLLSTAVIIEVRGSDQEKARIDAWLNTNRYTLDQYGHPIGTCYAGGTPLFQERTGQRIDRYEYIIANNSTKPWMQCSDPEQEALNREKVLICAWVLRNKDTLNSYGDPRGTRYADDQKMPNKYDYIISRHPDRPWTQQ